MTISTNEREVMPGEMLFPEEKLIALEEKISHQRWVVPVLPEQELEALMTAAYQLAEKGEDMSNVLCNRFYNDSLAVSFTKLLTDDAVTSWKGNIQQCVRTNCEKLVQFCVIKLDDPRFLNLLAMAFNPNNKFHTFNASRTSEGLTVIPHFASVSLSSSLNSTGTNSIPANGAETNDSQGSSHDEEIFAQPHDLRSPRGWLVHLLNVFGQAGGFAKMRERFEAITGLTKPDLSTPEESEKVTTDSPEKEMEKNETCDNGTSPINDVMEASMSGRIDQPLSLDGSNGDTRVSAVWQLLRPISLCLDLLTQHTIVTYLVPILECIPTLLESLTDEELKKEARSSENKTDTVTCLIRACKCVAEKTPNHQHLLKPLELFRLKMILRLLQMSSFNGKMSALNEINQIIGSISQLPKPDWLTPSIITNWIRDNNVVDIVFRDSLHQPQYVERLEKMLRFMIKENSLTKDDLDAIWRAQHGKHEAIVKNLHDLLAKLAWDFTPDQLDHLFDCFKASWATSSKKQSDKLLEVIRRLAEDDKDGVMANKVLVLFWNLAHSDEVCTEIIDVALANIIKILDYSCSQDRNAQKSQWLDKCVEELKTNDKWVIPALTMMREICGLYDGGGGGASMRQHLSRQQLIDRLQTQHSLVILVTDSLTQYMDGVRKKLAEDGKIDWDSWLPDGRYAHGSQVHERLSFLRFLLKDGQLWLCAEQAKQIWICLAEKPAHLGDREACFRWFSKLMGEEPDLDPNIIMHFFRNNIMTLSPTLLTHSGMKCFERFFKSVNSKEDKLKLKRRSFLITNADLTGLEYLWRVITECDDEISARGIELLRDVCTCVGPLVSVSQHHESFLTQCCTRLQELKQQMEQEEEVTESCTRMCRILRAIQNYVNECDKRFNSDRQMLPVYRSGRGRHFTIIVRFNFQTGLRQVDDVELHTHSNETLHSLRANILRRLKSATDGTIKVEFIVKKMELYVNTELVDSSHDRKTLAQILRDKTVIIAKVFDGQACGSGGCVSSNDSSSDSSRSSPPLPFTPELALPGVLLSHGYWYLPFVLELEHIGVMKNHMPLIDAAHVLSQICPAHKQTMEQLTEALLSREDTKLKDMLYGANPPTVAYNLEVLYSMVMPSSDTKLERSRNFQLSCVKKAPLLVQCLSDKEFLKGAAPHTRRVGFLALVRLSKLALNTLGHLLEMLAPEATDTSVDKDLRINIPILREALKSNGSHYCELVVKAIAEKLGNTLAEQVVAGGEDSDSASSLVWWRVPTAATVRALYTLAHSVAQPDLVTGIVHGGDDVTLVRECMEVISICMALGGANLEMLLLESWWQEAALYLMIDCPNPQMRVSCAEQLLTMCGWGCGGGARAALCALGGVASGPRLQMHARHAQQFLQLLCRLIALAGPTPRTLDDLAVEVAWLRAVKNNPHLLDDTLFEGHLNLTKELLVHVPTSVKHQYGANPDHEDSGLIKEVITEFLWPYSWSWCAGGSEPLPPLCRAPGAASAACDLLLALVHGCVPNMAALADLLTQMFYSDKNVPLSDWEYMPCVGPRPPAGLVGLKNAGATCYMNSVLQQLYCVPAVRDRLLVVQGAATDPNEDFSGEDHHIVLENNTEGSGDYNITILKQVQAIFAHLHYSKLQYYVPRGLWAYFRLQGEPVNLREQQDAVEFFMSLVESLDEALKSLGQEQFMAQTLGGTYSDQKICKECPHRYCKEEPFSVVSLDIRNMSRLQESLEAYVRGELLEGADAYHCDKCNKKVVTVKRLCLNKLPPVLVIQLKRFEYDFEKVCAIKFNDYFEFPRELDVEPYTVWGLARAEGDATLCEGGDTPQPPETHYQLTGIVVHSGQASGGHYYSYILLRDNGSETGRWVKLDDGEVSECGMHDDEEMKAQCFGGEYMGEMFDQILKRVSYKRQKRWWNAYMLFYTRKDTIQNSNLENCMKAMTLKDNSIPKPIWHSVRKSNVAFSHNQDQFSLEHLNFMKKLCCMRLHISPNSQSAVWGPEQEEMSMIAVQLASKFLFQIGFRTKKNLRGPASDWYDILCQHLRCSQNVRAWFAIDLFKNPHRLCDYLIVCPSMEVRLVFMKIVVFLAHFSVEDPPVPSGFGSWCSRDEVTTLSDQVLCSTRALSNPSNSPHLDSHSQRHLPLLFNLFYAYAALGVNEKYQLIRLKILDVVLSVCMDDSTSSLVKYQYCESAKVHQVVSVLVRCCDVSARCQSAAATDRVQPLANPHAETPPDTLVIPQLSAAAVDILYNKTSYMKKLTEDCCGCEDGIKLLQFLCWENAGWSRMALAELLWQMAYAYCHELRRYSDALTALLLLEDSWQQHRIHNTLKGVSEERPGLLETAWRSRSHYQKRAYACIKLVVGVLARAPIARAALSAQLDARRRWRQLLNWLQDELDRKYGAGGYSYGTWSPPGTSNETSNGYFLERSNSARKTLERAIQLCPEQEEEEEDNRESGLVSGEAGDGDVEGDSGEDEEGASEEGAGPAYTDPSTVHFDDNVEPLTDDER